MYLAYGRRHRLHVCVFDRGTPLCCVSNYRGAHNCVKSSRFALTLLLLSCPARQVDAFTDTKFGGNPAAVFFTQAGGDADWMQKVVEGKKARAKTAWYAVGVARKRSRGAPAAKTRLGHIWLVFGVV